MDGVELLERANIEVIFQECKIDWELFFVDINPEDTSSLYIDV